MDNTKQEKKPFSEVSVGFLFTDPDKVLLASEASAFDAEGTYSDDKNEWGGLGGLW